MNSKKKLRKFFTLNWKANDGFTLVELIVVIAILAILGGVAVPAYSGYVERAERAADEALLNEINTAFASACAVNGTDNYKAASQNPALITTAVPYEVSVYNDEFKQFYTEKSEFKTDPIVMFDALKGMFVMVADGGSVTLNYAGTLITVSSDDIQALANSTYASIGAQDLLTEIANLTAWADGDGNAIVDALGDEYYASLATYLGFSTGEELDNYLAIIEQEQGEEAVNRLVTNGIVLYAADNFSQLTTESITNLLNSDNIYNNLSDDKAVQLAEASMVYGLYTSYVNSSYYTGEPITETDPVAIVKTASSDTKFNEYVNSEMGQADLEAYIAAMGVITDATANPDAVSDVLLNGYDNDELIALLQQALGN